MEAVETTASRASAAGGRARADWIPTRLVAVAAVVGDKRAHVNNVAHAREPGRRGGKVRSGPKLAWAHTMRVKCACGFRYGFRWRCRKHKVVQNEMEKINRAGGECALFHGILHSYR